MGNQSTSLGPAQPRDEKGQVHLSRLKRSPPILGPNTPIVPSVHHRINTDFTSTLMPGYYSTSPDSKTPYHEPLITGATPRRELTTLSALDPFQIAFERAEAEEKLPRTVSGNLLAGMSQEHFQEKLTLEERVERIKRTTRDFSVHNMVLESARNQKKSARAEISISKRKRGCCGGCS